jgi:hypothetical protein
VDKESALNPRNTLIRRLLKSAWVVSIFASSWASTTIAQTPAAPEPVPQLGLVAEPTSPTPAEPVGLPEIGQAVPPGAAPPPQMPCPPAAPSAPTGPRWVTPLPRVGMFAIPPTGCGYYSALDLLRGEVRQTPPKYPYPRFGLIQQPNFDVNWAYLKDPKNTEHDYADRLKWIPIADGVTFTTGGDLRYRFMHEQNSNNRLSGLVDSYDLYRARVYGDLWVNDWLRVYGEFLYADFTRRSLPALATDADRGDILNLFADVRVLEFGEKDNPVYVRIGRQELLYGSQRLVSPLEWVNTRRTFQGVKVFTRTAKWDFDLFAVQPVIPPQANQFDSVDNNQIFSGAWFTYRPLPGQAIDLYYLNLDNTNPGVAVGQGGVRGAYNVNTVGARYAGTAKNWLWDGEGMFQFGGYSNQSIVAKSFAAAGGYHFKECAWEPQFWVGYEYASGDPDPQNSGTRRTFNQIFPFGHYFFGYTDVVGRQNINDVFVQGIAYPAKWLTLVTQFHVFRLDSDRDALYAPSGAVLRRDPTGRAGNDVGNNLDLRANVHLTNHSDVLFGYSRLFAGDYIRNTAPAANPAAFSADPSVFYAQYTYRW